MAAACQAPQFAPSPETKPAETKPTEPEKQTPTLNYVPIDELLQRTMPKQPAPLPSDYRVAAAAVKKNIAVPDTPPVQDLRRRLRVKTAPDKINNEPLPTEPAMIMPAAR